MNGMELLNWARGPGLQIATAIMLLGVSVRLLQIWLLGRKPNLSLARASGTGPGWRTVFSRSIPSKQAIHTSPVVVIGGYIFHLGFFLTLLFFTPHILLFADLTGLRWPALPNSIIDVMTGLSILAMAGLLVHRFIDPVRRLLSTFGDYFTGVVSLLPLLTGYLAYHRMGLPYTDMLALHILSVELLMIVLPFSKLMHAFSFAISRWYTGAMAGRKGVEA